MAEIRKSRFERSSRSSNGSKTPSSPLRPRADSAGVRLPMAALSVRTLHCNQLKREGGEDSEEKGTCIAIHGEGVPNYSPSFFRVHGETLHPQLAMKNGHLKEQDPLFHCVLQFVTKPLDSLFGMTIKEAFSAMETMINEYVDDPAKNRRLLKYAPNVRRIFLKLDLMTALAEFDSRNALTQRVFVPPTFKEVRQIFSLAMIHSFAKVGKLVTFDADDTIYEDGGVVHATSPMRAIITDLMTRGINVSLCTAAGYPGNARRYEERLRGLLDGFLESNLSDDTLQRFMVMGGECNYLLRLKKTVAADGTASMGLEFVEEKLWKDGRGVRWNHDDIMSLLDRAEAALRECADALRLKIDILRKERSVGMINLSGSRFSYEVLEETALSVQYALSGYEIPFCAFNGGNDVWVDVGNKALGIRALQKWYHIDERECLHVGDRFTQTGNDAKAREVSNTLWVTNPQETEDFMKILLTDVDRFHAEAAAGSAVGKGPEE